MLCNSILNYIHVINDCSSDIDSEDDVHTNHDSTFQENLDELKSISYEEVLHILKDSAEKEEEVDDVENIFNIHTMFIDKILCINSAQKY